MTCPACDSPAYTLLGDLGYRRHCRCRDCGTDFSFVPGRRADAHAEASEWADHEYAATGSADAAAEAYHDAYESALADSYGEHFELESTH